MLRGTALRAALAGLCALVSLCPASGQLSQRDTEIIVELHNKYRGLVAPSAADMTKVKWDEGLKIIAEGYAVKCVWDHNPDLKDMNTGENLFVSNEPFDPNLAMAKWFMEQLDYDYNNNSCQEDRLCGHYTQMVWANSHSVGCAVHHCDTMEGLPFGKANFLVCNYFPAGNKDNEKPYKEGQWCSMCPENLPQCDQNLCVPEQLETTDNPSLGPEMQSTHAATDDTYNRDDTELKLGCPLPTATKSVSEDDKQWTGDGQATDREKVRIRGQPQSNVGRISTSLILISTLATLLLLEF